MKKTAFITGILGQDGGYLAKLLLEKDYQVFGMVRRYSSPNFSNLQYLGIDDRIEYVSGDLTDSASLLDSIKNIRPDEVYNLGAQSFVGTSWQQAQFTTEVNAIGVLRLLDAIKFFSPTTRFYQASTSEMYGNNHDGHGFQDENTPFHPRSPYAIAKLYAYWITINYRESYSLFCTNGILFNHESPIRGIEFVTRKISDGVAQIAHKRSKEIRLGNLDSQRDWGFAGDYVEAMWRMLQAETPGDFVVATGQSHSIRDFLDAAFDHVGIKDWKDYVHIDPKYKRPAELHTLHGKPSKAEKELGWKPKVKFNELVKMMVDADMKRYDAIEAAEKSAKK